MMRLASSTWSWIRPTAGRVGLDGVDLVGPLPDGLQTVTVYAAGILVKAEQPDAAGTLVEFLRTPAAAAVFRARGLEAVERP